MSRTQVYPATLYEPDPLIDLSDRSERKRLSPDAVRAFVNIMTRWKIRDEDARQLLGGMPNDAYYMMKKEPDCILDEDRLYRISYLVGIFKALTILHDEELAARWMQLPNRNRVFGGTTPLQYLLRGGLPAFVTLRRLLDAQRSGP